MFRIRQGVTLARLTALEAIRQPLCLLLATACIVLTALAPLVLLHKFSEDGKMARDTGLACHFVFGVFIAGYAACSSLAREVRGGTAAAILSKPVGRATFFFAKFAGLAAVVTAFSFCATLATLLAERVAERFVFTGQAAGNVIDWQTGNLLLAAPFAAMLLAALANYLGRSPFQSTAFGFLILVLGGVLVFCGLFDRTGDWAPYALRVQWRIVRASALITLALVTLSAIALALSTRLGEVPTITVCVLVFLLGLMSDYLLGRQSERSVIASALYGLLPNWQHFWVADALNAGGGIPGSYLLRAGVYALAYSAGALCLGALSFRYREAE